MYLSLVNWKMPINEFLTMWLTAVFATYFISVNLARMEGPASVFDRLREEMGAYTYDAQGRPLTALGRMATCPYCWGSWIAIVITALIFPFNWTLPIYWLAVGGGVYTLLGVTQ